MKTLNKTTVNKTKTTAANAPASAPGAPGVSSKNFASKLNSLAKAGSKLDVSIIEMLIFLSTDKNHDRHAKASTTFAGLSFIGAKVQRMHKAVSPLQYDKEGNFLGKEKSKKAQEKAQGKAHYLNPQKSVTQNYNSMFDVAKPKKATAEQRIKRATKALLKEKQALSLYNVSEETIKDLEKLLASLESE